MQNANLKNTNKKNENKIFRKIGTKPENIEKYKNQILREKKKTEIK